MPENKKQLRRIKGIDDRLNRTRRIKKNRLAYIFDVKNKTIQRDIKFMKEEYDAPIANDNDGYYYNEKFSIPLNLALTGDEIRQLKLAVKTLNQFQHLDAFKDLGGLIEKIEKSVRFKLPNANRNFIHFESVPFYEGTELIEFFINAIESTRIVDFDYQSFKSETPIHHAFHPYILKEHTNRWYVIGWLPSENSITSFALERIIQNQNLKLTESYFNIRPDFKINDYFKYTYGMTVYSKKKVEEVILSFSPLQAKYFKSKPFHHHEEIDENAERLTVKMYLIPNYELVRKLASMGNGVKVIQPKSLIRDLNQFFSNALKQYQ